VEKAINPFAATGTSRLNILFSQCKEPQTKIAQIGGKKPNTDYLPGIDMKKSANVFGGMKSR